MNDVSVIMTTYNDEPAFLKTCIESVLTQTYQAFDFIIVVEPGERNLDILRDAESRDNRVKVLVNERRLGISGSRNRAITTSSGEYIAFIDGDDFCALERFERQRAVLESNPDLSAVGSNMMLVDKDSNIVGKRVYPESNDNIRKYFLLTMGIANPTVMVRRKDLEEVGMFDPQLLKAEDMDLWLRFLQFGKKMYNLQENLVSYRLPAAENLKRNKMHMQNIYAARKEHGRFIWSFPERHLSLLFWFLISHIPDTLIGYVLKLSIVRKLRKYSKMKQPKLHAKVDQPK